MNDRAEVIPLSLTQQDIYFDQLHFGRSPLYNVGGYIRLGRCDVDRLQQAHARLVSTNDVFGIRIRSTDKGVCQEITSQRTTTLPLVDLSGEVDPVAAAKSRLESLFQEPFQIEDNELYRAFVIKLADDRFWYVCMAHHLIMDGWGFSNLARVLGEFYHGQAPEPPPAWQEIVSSDQAYLASEKYGQDREYWLSHCGEAPEKLLTPFYEKRFKDAICIPSGRQSIKIAPAEYEEVRALAGSLGVGLTEVLLGVLLAYFSQAYGKERLIAGVPAHNRRGHREKRMLGAFTSVSPLCVASGGELSFAELTRSLRETQRKNFRHQRYPIGHLIRDLGLTGRNHALYDIGFNYLKLNSFLNVGGEQAELVYLTHFREATPLTLTVWEYGDELPIALQFDYNHAYFEAVEGERIGERFLHLLRAVQAGDGAGARLSMLPLMTENERRGLLSASTGAQSRTRLLSDKRQGVHHRFESQVDKDPDRTAVVGEGRTLRYAELNSRANQLARHLLSQGVVGGSSLVAVCLRRSPDLIVALMAVLKAGAAYVPLDPDYPRSRLDYMLSDCRASLILTESSAKTIARQEGVPSLELDDPSLADKLRGYSSRNLERSPDFSARNLAYVMYTSGSTGRPKGVMVSHGNLESYYQAINLHYAIGADDTSLQFSSCSFDIFVEEVFACLLSGGRLVLRSDEVVAGGDVFWRFVQDNKVTLFAPPTAFWHSLCAGLKGSSPPVDRLRLVSVGGEAMSEAMLRRWRNSFGSGVALLNAYGPTEGTISATIFNTDELEGRTGGVPIGRPLANTRCYVLDQSQRLTAPGLPGELYLAGDGLTQGYLNQPDLTAQNFLPNPFGAPGDRLYKTGDLVRQLPNGALEFLGRVDEQLKIRGFRIEPREIESALLECDVVKEAVVRAHGNPPELVAYVVPAGEADIVSRLKSHLRKTLPEYMVPSAIVRLETLPLTRNGKVDRSRLPRPMREDYVAKAYVAPRHQMEAKLSRIWATVLQLEKVGVDDHFFEIGGSSLVAVDLQRTINARLGTTLKVTDLFANPTVEDLAAHISSQADARFKPQADRRTQERISGREDVAVIAMACRFPDADTPEAFWQNLNEGKESIQFFSDQQLREAGVPQELLERPNYVKSGFVLDGVANFDDAFFRFTPREAELLDPQQRLLFECAQEALERGGYGRRDKLNRTGVFVSVGQNRYLFERILPNRELVETLGETAVMLANLNDFAATRLSYKLDLRGPSVNVNTACSSSLVAVHLACASLLDGSSEMALAGASSIAMFRPTGVLADEGGLASSDGRCRAFDADADGTRPGSGAGMLLLKRLTDAVADGDPILAVIKGSAINNDGANRVGYAAPGVDGQALVISEALRAAGVSATEVSYLEAHGTGTKLGDPIEFAALRKVFPSGDRAYCAVGSVKPNIGHLDSASGMASLIKVAMALQHRKLPPQILFNRANPEIDLNRGPFFINRETIDWDGGPGPRTAGVNSFGIGGANAHVVLQQAPVCSNEASHRDEQLFLFSARTEPALSLYRRRMAEFVAGQPDVSLADMAYTLQTGRTSHAFRISIVARSLAELSRALSSPTGTERGDTAPEIVFMFPGIGSQYVGMGLGIYRQEPVFRELFDRCAELLEPELGLDIRRVVFPEDESAEVRRSLDETRIAHPLLFALEYALAELLRAWGVRPSQMIGDGLGECVAACLADVFDLPDALRVAAARGRLLQGAESEAHFRSIIESVSLRSPGIPFVSNLTGQAIGPEQARDPDYWLRQLRSSRRFSEAAGTLTADESRVFLEVGPGSSLSSVVRQCNRAARTATTMGTRHEKGSNERPLLIGLGRLWEEGVGFDHAAFFARDRRRKIVLPTHPFQRRRHWVDQPPSTAVETLAEQDRFYLPVWRREELAATAPPSREEDWLILESGCGLGAALAQALEKRGQRVQLFLGWSGNSSAHRALRVVDLSDQRECRRLIESIRGTSFNCGRVVIPVPPPARPQSEVHDMAAAVSNCVDQFLAALNLARAVAATRPAEEVHFDLLTRASHSVTGLEDVDPDAATLAGLCKVIPQEFSGLSCRQIDLDRDGLEGMGPTIPRGLIDELLASGVAGGEVAYRGCHRWVRSFLPVKAEDWSSRPSLLRKQGVHVITGGLGRIGLALAEFLGRQYQAKLALIGRSEFPAKPEWKRLLSSAGLAQGALEKIRTLTEIEDCGAEVMVLSADVADSIQMERALAAVEREFGAIHGVIHCAGRAEAAPEAIQDMSREYLVDQFAPKVAGIRVLDQRLSGRDFDFCLSMSSLSAVLGGLGFAADAGANSFLDSFAHLKRNQGDKRWISINWDAWDYDGPLPAARRHRFSMSPQEGQRAFDRALRKGCGAQVVHSNGALDQRLGERAAQSKPGFGLAATGLSGARPELAVEYVAPRFRIETELAEIWRRFLGFEKIGVHDDFFALGGDSLLLTRVIAEINRRWRVSVSIKTAFERSTIVALAVSLAGLVAAGQGSDSDQAEFVEELI